MSRTRVGVISVRQAILNTAEGKQATAELQSQFAPRQTELQNLSKQIQDAQARGQQQTTPDDERARLARSIDAWTRAADRSRTAETTEAAAAEPGASAEAAAAEPGASAEAAAAEPGASAEAG